MLFLWSLTIVNGGCGYLSVGIGWSGDWGGRRFGGGDRVGRFTQTVGVDAVSTSWVVDASGSVLASSAGNVVVGCVNGSAPGRSKGFEANSSAVGCPIGCIVSGSATASVIVASVVVLSADGVSVVDVSVATDSSTGVGPVAGMVDMLGSVEATVVEVGVGLGDWIRPQLAQLVLGLGLVEVSELFQELAIRN